METRPDLGSARRTCRKDHGEAAKWYRLAAEQGNAWGQGNLGEAYAKGEGVPQDYIKAYAWLNLAAAGLKLPQRGRNGQDARTARAGRTNLAPAEL